MDCRNIENSAATRTEAVSGVSMPEKVIEKNVGKSKMWHKGKVLLPKIMPYHNHNKQI